MLYTFVFTLAVIFSFIECSSHSDRNLQTGRYPRRPPASPSEEQHTPGWTPTGEPAPRARSRSPAGSPRPIMILGYPLEQLGFVRLIPRSNQNLRFEFRYYIFPDGIPISWKGVENRLRPVPAGENVVLSASNGEFFAILTNSGFLLGIYRRQRGTPRVKMNMRSGAIYNLTADEIRDCPVGRNHPIFPQCFIKAFSNHDSLQFKWSLNSERNPDPSSVIQHSTDCSLIPEESLIRGRSKSPPIRPPSDHVLGYPMAQLGYLRLFSRTNPTLQFEFRRYVFPLDKPIRMRIYDKRYVFSPNTECIVLSTSSGDIFAILDHSGTLCGIYRTDKNNSRIKMNMMSGALVNMTPDEKRDCPTGKNRPIFPHSFIEALTELDSLQVNYNSCRQLIRGSSSSSDRQHSPDRTPQQDPDLDARSPSPPGRPPSDEVLGYPLAELGYIRLIPRTNQHRQFEFRKYVFPSYMRIHLMSGHGKYVLVPNREHIVLTTSIGDVFAILEYTGILRGIYLTIREKNYAYLRIKINILSGEVDCMTEYEMKECHVGNRYPIIPRWFNKTISNEDSLQYMYH